MSIIHIVVLSNLMIGIAGKLQLCEVETGQTNIILDIEESRGDCEFNALTKQYFSFNKYIKRSFHCVMFTHKY